MANSDKDILITPNTGSSSADPKIEYVGADSSGNDTITVETLYDGTKSTLSFEGSAGQLFSIVNDLTSDPIFSVNDVSGIPSIEVDSDGEIRLAEFSGNVGIGTSSPSGKLEVADSDGGATVFINNTQSWTASALSEFNNTALAISPRASGAKLRFSGATGDVRIQSLTSDLSTAEDISLNPVGGNVGIGTTSPGAALDITASGAQIHVYDSSTYVSGTSGGELLLQGLDSLSNARTHATIAGFSTGSNVGGLKFSVNNLGQQEVMRLDSSGNVGIGVVPSAWSSSSTALQIGSLAIEDFVVSGANASVFFNNSFRNSSDNIVYIESDFASAYSQYNGEHNFNVAPSGTAGATLSFTNAMKITNSANVGIGTITPAQKLSVSGASGSARISLERSNANTTGGVGFIQWNALDGHAVAGILAYGDGNDEGAHIAFNTTSAASSSDVYASTSERMRINSSGNVGIGTSSPEATLHVHGTAEEVIRVDSGNTGAIHFFEGSTRRGIIGYSNGSSITTYADAGDMVLRAESGKKLHLAISGTSQMVVDSSGNVGIGTTSPNQDGFGTPSRVLTVKAATSGGKGALELIGLANTSGDLMSVINFMSYAVTTPAARITAVRHTSDTEAAIAFDTSGTERMRITHTGNVGIGTTDPSAKLDIQVSNANGTYGASSVNLNIENTNTSVTEGGWLTISGYMGNTANSGQYSMGGITGGKQTTAADGNYGGYLAFWTTSGGANGEANSGMYERMRINSAGQTLINTTDGNMPTAGGNAPCVIYGGAGNGFADNALHVGGGRISLNAQPNSNSTRGYIECSGAGFKIWHVDNSDMIFGVNNVEKMRIQYADGRIKSQATYDNAAPATHRDVYVENSGQLGYASSVRAHKTNINSYGDASWLYQIDPKTFNYRKPNTTLVTNDDGFTEEVRDGTYSDTEYYDTVEVGFIAEDVEEHDPNLCFYNEVEDEDGNVTNELAGIHYKSMVVPMLKLIKEQKGLIDNLTARITELEG